MPREGILFILVGPSGAGKNTLMKIVQEQLDDLPQLATITTRGIRAGETEGVEHRFVTQAKFQHLIDTDALIEYQEVHDQQLYGTPRQPVEDALNAGYDLIADIDCLGASKIHAAYPDNTVLIFVTPSRLDFLAKRIQQRGEITAKKLAGRLQRARFEITFAPSCHYLVLNDIVEPAAEYLRQIVINERPLRRGGTSNHRPCWARPTFHSYTIAVIQHHAQLLLQTDRGHNQLPTFPTTNHTLPPHEVLQQALHQALDQTVNIETTSHKNSDFVPPHLVTIATIPQDVYLYFYYKCSLTTALPSHLPGWSWHPPDVLTLPTLIEKLIAPAT